MTSWVTLKLLDKSTDFSTTVALIPHLMCTIYVNVSHATFISTVIGTIATDITSYSILAVDFMLNLVLLHGIITLHRKISVTEDTEKEMIEKRNHILELFAIETVEFLAPIVYSIIITMAYYGPNAELFGGV